MHTEACLIIPPISFDWILGLHYLILSLSLHDRRLYLNDLVPALDRDLLLYTYATISNTSTMTRNRRKTMVRTVRGHQEI